MSLGAFGWRCECGLDTVRARDKALDRERAAACYPCKRFYEIAPEKCGTCGGPLTPLSRPDLIERFDEDAARKEAHDRYFAIHLERLFLDRIEPEPPIPIGEAYRTPGHLAVLDAWKERCRARWEAGREAAARDTVLAEEVERVIAPLIESDVLGQRVAERKRMCPRCGRMSLWYAAFYYPR